MVKPDTLFTIDYCGANRTFLLDYYIDKIKQIILIPKTRIYLYDLPFCRGIQNGYLKAQTL